MEILAAEETGHQEITPGTPVLVKGAPEVVVDLAGVARIRARGPAGTVEELREEVNKEARNLEALTAGFGTADMDELEARSEQFHSIQQKVSDAQTRLDTLLSNTTAEEIEQESRKTERIIEEISRAYPGWTDTPPDADSLRTTAREIKQAFVTRVDEAELKNEKAAQAFQAANVKIAKVQAEHGLRDREVKSISEKLDHMQKDGMDDQQRSAKLGEISLEWDAARSATEKLETELSRFQDDPRLLAERLEKQRNAIQDQASNALELLKKEEGRLEQLATSGPYSALSQVEEQIAELKTQIDSEELRINAIRLLRDTVHHCKAKILSDLRKPVEESATRMIQRIAGTRLGTVQLADRFQPQAVTPRMASRKSPSSTSPAERPNRSTSPSASPSQRSWQETTAGSSSWTTSSPPPTPAASPESSPSWKRPPNASNSSSSPAIRNDTAACPRRISMIWRGLWVGREPLMLRRPACSCFESIACAIRVVPSTRNGHEYDPARRDR